MSCLKVSIMLSTGVLLVGLSSAVMSQDAPPPRDGGEHYSGPAQGNQQDAGGADAARRLQSARSVQDSLVPVLPDDRTQPPHPTTTRGRFRLDESEPRQQIWDRAKIEADRYAIPEYEYNRQRAIAAHRLDLETDPELYKATQADRELESQSHVLAEQYRRAGSSDNKAKIKEDLVQIVNQHFEVRQQLRNLEVKRLEQQVKQLHDKIELRAKNRKDLIEKRMIELTGEDEGEHF